MPNKNKTSFTEAMKLALMLRDEFPDETAITHMVDPTTGEVSVYDNKKAMTPGKQYQFMNRDQATQHMLKRVFGIEMGGTAAEDLPATGQQAGFFERLDEAPLNSAAATFDQNTGEWGFPDNKPATDPAVAFLNPQQARRVIMTDEYGVVGPDNPLTRWNSSIAQQEQELKSGIEQAYRTRMRQAQQQKFRSKKGAK